MFWLPGNIYVAHYIRELLPPAACIRQHTHDETAAIKFAPNSAHSLFHETLITSLSASRDTYRPIQLIRYKKGQFIIDNSSLLVNFLFNSLCAKYLLWKHNFDIYCSLIKYAFPVPNIKGGLMVSFNQMVSYYFIV